MTTTDTDMMKLYSKRILALAAELPFAERLSAPDGTARKRSPLCGSTVTVDVSLEGDRVTDYGQDVKACALGQAAASVVGANVIGRNLSDIETARDELRAMLKSGGPVPQAPFDGFEVLEPARDFKNRHASILLTLDALVDAIRDGTSA